MPSRFVNLSNHPSREWPPEQRHAALGLAEEIVDVPFPSVPPAADPAEVERLAEGVLKAWPDEACEAMVSGEFCLTVALVRDLQARGVRCWVATTVRDTVDGPGGTKTSRFVFVRFREYPRIARG